MQSAPPARGTGLGKYARRVGTEEEGEAMSWSGGLAEWTDGSTVHLSVAFTWRLDDAYERALYARNRGLQVVAGGPALFLVKLQHRLATIATIDQQFPDAVARHNSLATIASRGCPVGCWFCIVPKMEGRTFTLLPDFPVRPILCDNNLSALSPEYQDHIVARYRATDTPLLDANSGFEPATFTDDVYARWKPINRGPWRFAFDESKERADVLRVLHMLRNEPAKRKRVYVLIGNEPVAACMERIAEIIANGGEPHVQPYIKLNALRREPHVRFDWTRQHLIDVARWANGFLWRRIPFAEYDRSRKKLQPRRPLVDDPESTQQGSLFV